MGFNETCFGFCVFANQPNEIKPNQTNQTKPNKTNQNPLSLVPQLDRTGGYLLLLVAENCLSYLQLDRTDEYSISFVLARFWPEFTLQMNAC